MLSQFDLRRKELRKSQKKHKHSDKNVFQTQIQKQSLDQTKRKYNCCNQSSFCTQDLTIMMNSSNARLTGTTPFGASQLLNLPSSNTTTPSTQKLKGLSNRSSPKYMRKLSTKPGTPNTRAQMKKSSNSGSQQPHYQTQEQMGQSLRALLKDKNTGENIGADLESNLQNASKNPRRKKTVTNNNTFKSQSRGNTPGGNMFTPQNFQSQKGGTGVASAMSRRSDSNIGRNRMASAQHTDQHQKQQQHQQYQQQQSSGLSSSSHLRPPLKPMNANSNNAKLPMPQSKNLKRGNSKVISYFEHLSMNSNLHSSSYEESQPQISAANLFSQNSKENEQSSACLVIKKQETSDFLDDVSEEKHQRQLQDFAQAKTCLYDFQVRKSPRSKQLQPDEAPAPFLQIPDKSTIRKGSGHGGQMFLHPYAHTEQMSEDSTRMNSNRFADASSITMQSRAKHDKTGVADQSYQEKEQQSFSQSLFSALGNFVTGGTSKAKETSPTSSREVNFPQRSQTFSSIASMAAFANQRNLADNSNNQIMVTKENPLIQIQETQEPLQTEIPGNESFNSRMVYRNERSNSNAYGYQHLPMETEMPNNVSNFGTENSVRMNTLAKFTSQNLQVVAGGRNENLKTQAYLGGFSTFSSSRSPMKSRHFTKPAQKPQEDEIVESMNIVTLDLLEEAKQAQNKAMKISEPAENNCDGCPDCHARNSRMDTDDGRRGVPPIQQRTTTLNGNNTVCSCSGCMASQTAYENTQENELEQGSKPTRICLETVLNECEQIRALYSLLAQPKSNQVMILNQKRIILDRIQTYCEEWWGASSQFHNLHGVFEQDGTQEGQQISLLIKKSQVILCVTVGLIAAVSIEIQNSYLEQTIISQTFWVPRLILQKAYSVQMKLTSIILGKMDSQERMTNEFAIMLQQRINSFKEEIANGQIVLNSQSGDDLSQLSDNSENSRELEKHLTNLIQNQADLLQEQCNQSPLPGSAVDLYQNLYCISSDITELNVAKDLIANEVNSIQEHVAKIQDEQNRQVLSLQEEEKEVYEVKQDFLRPPALQTTPAMSSTSTQSLPENIITTKPIEQQLLDKQIVLKKGELSEIGEVLSTEQNPSPSVEPEISRISNHTNSGINGLVQSKSEVCVTKEEREDDVDLYAHEELQEQAEIREERATTIAHSAVLPPSTKKYTLVLDLDETLIHSHVQFKRQLTTRAQQQEYYQELQQKFQIENGREPSKEEVENMALEMVFNIRPFAEEFLNIMSKQFEITVFTAGEQDYADEILNTLDTDGTITHRLYRQHTLQVKDVQSGCTKHYIKDLSRTGRDLSKTIIIDNIKENFCRQPKNGIQITTWKDDPYDTELMYLQRLLCNMLNQNPEDIRECLERFKENGLLPQHFVEPIFDESSSFQQYEPVVVAVNQTTPSATDKNLLSVGKDNGQQDNSHSINSIDSYRSSVKQKSVHNSSYQKRRLSAQSDKQRQAFAAQEEEQKVTDPTLQVNQPSMEAECFFVDEVPVRVEIKDIDCIARQGIAAVNIEGRQSTDMGTSQMSTAFVETNQGGY